MELLLKDIIKDYNAKEQAESYIREQAAQKHLIIFGCSSTGKIVLEELVELGIKPLCFADDVEYVNYKEYDGVHVYSMDEASEKYTEKKNITIVLCVNHFDQYNMVREQLVEHGFNDFIDKDLVLFLHKLRNLKDNRINCCLNVEDKQDNIIIAMDKIEFNITAKCTLRCKDCCQLLYMTDYLGHSDTQLTVDTIDHFARTVDYCALVEVFGGEPLLHPNLYAILDAVSSHINILEVVVDTNGTLMPKDDLLSLMMERRIAMRITDYGEVSSKKYLISDKCLEYNIPCTIKKVSQWNIYGLAEKSMNQENDTKFNSCVSANKCSSLIEGKWHVCARNAHMTRVGKLTDNDAEYINFVQEGVTISDNRSKMDGLLKRKVCLSSCAYCNGSDTLSMGGIQWD